MTDTPSLDALEVGNGLIGFVACPGRQDTGPRSLVDDVRRLREWGATRVLTLIESHEMLVLGVPSLRTEIRAAGLASHHLPVVDMCAPDHRFEADWPRVRRLLLGSLEAGERVVIHCRGGVGRTGAVTAGLLVEEGMDPAEAVERVRAARAGAIETEAQLAWVYARGNAG